MDVPSSLSELRRLRYFLAVADERNFTRAAQRVHIAQPALSRQIRQLERDLGAQLFVRSPQGVELTDAGRLLQELGASLAAAEDRMWQQVRALATGRTGSLAFGYSTSTSYGTAPALLEALERQAPGLTVSARMLPTAEIVSGVADGLLDAGLVRCPPPVPDLVRTRIRLDRQGVLLPGTTRWPGRRRCRRQHWTARPC
ncbi:LysR family transcriptional regulator [Streptacidiphilus monticola]